MGWQSLWVEVSSALLQLDIFSCKLNELEWEKEFQMWPGEKQAWPASAEHCSNCKDLLAASAPIARPAECGANHRPECGVL